MSNKNSLLEKKENSENLMETKNQQNKNFEKIKGLMPWIVRFTFEDDVCVEIQPYNLFEL